MTLSVTSFFQGCWGIWKLPHLSFHQPWQYSWKVRGHEPWNDFSKSQTHSSRARCCWEQTFCFLLPPSCTSESGRTVLRHLWARASSSHRIPITGVHHLWTPQQGFTQISPWALRRWRRNNLKLTLVRYLDKADRNSPTNQSSTQNLTLNVYRNA